MKQILQLQFLALLFCLTQSTQAQIPFTIDDPEDPGDNYGNGTQNMIGQRHYFWDVDSAKWDSGDTFNMSYNQQNLLVLQNWLKVDTSVNGPWKNIQVRTKEYDANNRLSVQVDTVPNPVTGQRYEFTYNANGKLIMLHQKFWDSGTASWKTGYRDQTTYTAFDSINVLLSEVYNISNVWVNLKRAIHAYNVANKDTATTYENWDIASSQWEGALRYIYTYDANGNKTSELYQEYDNSTLTYKNRRQYNYYYDVNNRMTNYSDSEWNTGTNG